MKTKLSLIASAMLLAQPVLSHHVVNTFDVEGMSQKASAVFHGTVVDVSYRGSNAGKGSSSVPHTFVTYEVKDVLVGDINRSQFTLRFMGGEDKNGNIMMTTQSPHFDVGDEDVLFVQGNGNAECPLVDCANGRFRIVDGMMFNEYGQQLGETEKGNISLGQLEDREEFNTFQIGKQKIKRVKHKSSSKESSGEDVSKKSHAGTFSHLDASSFVASTRGKIDRAEAKMGKVKRKQAKHMDKGKPFSLVVDQPGRAKHVSNIKTEMKAKTAQEKRELSAMKRSNGNPVAK